MDEPTITTDPEAAPDATELVTEPLEDNTLPDSTEVIEQGLNVSDYLPPDETEEGYSVPITHYYLSGDDADDEEYEETEDDLAYEETEETYPPPIPDPEIPDYPFYVDASGDIVPYETLEIVGVTEPGYVEQLEGIRDDLFVLGESANMIAAMLLFLSVTLICYFAYKFLRVFF